jgi:hypothetical protein
MSAHGGAALGDRAQFVIALHAPRAWRLARQYVAHLQ